MYRFQNSAIDSDHDLIISKFESMLEIVATEGYDRQGRRECIDLFRHYTSSHFKREEAAMRAARYPGFQDHVLAHAYLQNTFNRLVGTMPETSPNLRSDLSLFRQMFLFHILTHDETYGEWLRQRKRQRQGVRRSLRGNRPFKGLERPTRWWLQGARANPQALNPQA